MLLPAPPTDLDVQSTRDLRARGFEHSELARMRRTGELSQVRRGAYAAQIPTDPDDRHRQLVAATMPGLAGDACVSHQSAAVLHGLPAWPDQLDRVHVIRPRSSGGRRGTVVHVHPAPLSPDQVVQIGGLPVTSLARTIADCARTLTFERAVGLGDAALRQGMLRSDLLSELEHAAGRPGVPNGRRVAGFIDGRAESMGESVSRVLLQQAGLLPVELQFDVLGRSGEIVARTDFAWPEHRTIAEFDGRIKYGRLLREGETPGDVVFREKVREDMLRDLGWEVVRWIWAELRNRREIAARLERAFARGARR